MQCKTILFNASILFMSAALAATGTTVAAGAALMLHRITQEAALTAAIDGSLATAGFGFLGAITFSISERLNDLEYGRSADTQPLLPT